jgi:hypothetical protein
VTTLRIASEIALFWVVGGFALAALKRTSGARFKALSWMIFGAMLIFPAGRIGFNIYQIEAQRDGAQGTDTCFYRIGNSRRSYKC